MHFAPRVHEKLIEKAWAVDHGHESIAELWREVGREAERLQLPGPGYHAIRLVVRAERLRRETRAEAFSVVLDESTRQVPDVFRILDHVAAAGRLTRLPRFARPRVGRR